MVLKDKDVKKYFKSQYNKTFYAPRDIQFVVYDKEIWAYVKKLLRRAKNVVDLGAGGGTLLYNVSKATNAELIAIDMTEEAMSMLQKRVPRAKVLTEDILATSLGNKSCDFCLSTMTIEHVDDNKFLKEVFRILQPNGYFLVTSVLKTDNAWYFYKDKKGNSVLEPSHLREYSSIEQFKNLLDSNGFKVLIVKTPRVKFPLIDPLLKLLFRLFNNNFWGELPTTKAGEFLRKMFMVPVPGYYGIEVVAQRK